MRSGKIAKRLMNAENVMENARRKKVWPAGWKKTWKRHKINKFIKITELHLY